MKRICLWISILSQVAATSSAALARDMPLPPCAGPPTPSYPAGSDAPAIDVWLDQDLLEDWQPPACLGWQERPATVLLAVAGRFHHGGTSDDLLARLGEVSRYETISYWSRSRQRWRPLFKISVALSAPMRTAVREDFEADELRKGDQVFILQDEAGPIGEVIQRMSVIDRTKDRVEIAVTNVTAARIALLTMFEPGGSDMRLWIEHETDDRWTYYGLLRLSGAAMLARPALERSYANRAEALYRYLIDKNGQQSVD